MPPPQLASLPQPPFGSSPLVRPSGNPGAAANGSAMVQAAVDMLEKALAEIPVAHPLHKEVLSTISKLTKHNPPQAQSPGIGLQALKQLLAQKMQNSPLAALQAGQAGGAAPGGAAPGGAAPPMPTPAPTPTPPMG